MTKHEEEVVSLLKKIKKENEIGIKTSRDINSCSYDLGYRAGIRKAIELLSCDENFREELKKHPDIDEEEE